MSKMQRTKGKVWEREVAAKLRAIFGAQVKRGWQAREGCDAPDIEGVPRQWPECKHHAVVNIAAAMRQAVNEYANWIEQRGGNVTARDASRWPVVYSKSNRTEPLVTMRMADFLVLLREWKEMSDEVNFGVQSAKGTRFIYLCPKCRRQLEHQQTCPWCDRVAVAEPLAGKR